MDDKVAIITGSGKGYGKSIAKAYAENGYTVIIAEINTENGKSVSEEINVQGGKAYFIKTDISNVDEIVSLMKNVFERMGRIDVLINNAGLSEFYKSP
jgi:NAD(P)-dependent dehydrogenase (short-subunit alcohol dehydrogenase family)